MPLHDLHILPKLRDSMTYLYLERTVIQRYRNSVEAVDEHGSASIPIASLSVLMLGPGTRITHQAVVLLAESGCSIIWVGEDGTRYYANGTGETRKGYRLLHQARVCSDPTLHRQVAVAMYQYRFDEPIEDDASIESIRGREGVRVRNLYQIMSRRYGVPWYGRRYDRHDWDQSDPVNRSLSLANALLNGLCHAVIVSGGYSPGLGFIHTGKQLSFVYDIADLYKAELTIPLAFEMAALGSEDIEPRTRLHARDRFKKAKLMQRILPDIDQLLDVGDLPADDDAFDWDLALPASLWDDLEALPDEPSAGFRNHDDDGENA